MRGYVSYVVIVGLLLCIAPTAGCRKFPANTDPKIVALYNANEAVVALGSLSHAAIELNKQQICDTPTVNCRPILSRANTDVVTDVVFDALKVMGPTPTQWQGVVKNALNTIQARLDAAGKTRLSAYIQMVQLVAGIVEETR